MNKKPGRKPSNEPKKARHTITLDADLPKAIETHTTNLSGFLNDAGWNEINRRNKAGKAKK